MSSDCQEKNEITIKYVIPNDLKDCYVNGVWGMVSPKGEINMHLYSERLPIPNTETISFIDGNLGTVPVDTKAGGDVIRLVQSSIVMDIPTAIALQKWLGERIDYFFNKIKETKKEHKDV